MDPLPAWRFNQGGSGSPAEVEAASFGCGKSPAGAYFAHSGVPDRAAETLSIASHLIQVGIGWQLRRVK